MGSAMNEVRAIPVAEGEATDAPAITAALSLAPVEIQTEPKPDSLDAAPTIPAPANEEEVPAAVIVPPISATQAALEAAMPGEPEPVDHGIGVLLVNLGTPDSPTYFAV